MVEDVDGARHVHVRVHLPNVFVKDASAPLLRHLGSNQQARCVSPETSLDDCRRLFFRPILPITLGT
jgi:hypothetical protein